MNSTETEDFPGRPTGRASLGSTTETSATDDISVAGIALLSVFAVVFLFVIVVVVICIYKRRNKTGDDFEQQIDYVEHKENMQHMEYQKRHAALHPHDVTDSVVVGDNNDDSSLSDLDPFDSSDCDTLNSNNANGWCSNGDLNDNRVIIGRSRSMPGVTEQTRRYHSSSLDDSDDTSLYVKEWVPKKTNRSESSRSHKGILKNTDVEREKSIKKVHIVDSDLSGSSNSKAVVEVHANSDAVLGHTAGAPYKKNDHSGGKDGSEILARAHNKLTSVTDQNAVKRRVDGKNKDLLTGGGVLDQENIDREDTQTRTGQDGDSNETIGSNKARDKVNGLKKLQKSAAEKKTFKDKLFKGPSRKERKNNPVVGNGNVMNGHPLYKPGLPLHELVKPASVPLITTNDVRKPGVGGSEISNGVINESFSAPEEANTTSYL